MQPIIMHLDMNSYFASVEQQDHPEYRGRPLGVCEHLGGIIIAASVEAKRWGIKTGTPVWEAKKLFPKIILTQTHAERYRFFAKKFLALVGDYTDKVEPYSIDECFADLTRACNITNGRVDPVTGKADPFLEAANIAKQIKFRMKSEVGDWLKCSIGLADNKTLAKIGSDLKKPDGLTIILPDSYCHSGRHQGEPESRSNGFEFAQMYDPKILILQKSDLYQKLKLTDIPGIGKRQEKNLNSLGINTLAQLRDFPKSKLTARFGPILGHHLHQLGQLNSSWKAKVGREDEIKSMGHMYTLPKEFRKPEFFGPVLYKLCEMVGRRLRKKRLSGNLVHCFFYGQNYQSWGQSLRLGYFINDGREIFLHCLRALGYKTNSDRLIKEVKPPLPGEIKLVGVTVAGLAPDLKQLSLFGDDEKQRRLVNALDKINGKHGEFTVMRAAMAKAGKVFRDSVGFGRVKEL